jgi:light-regulated signal transduction histidine kinase (bacteriophytochrome)/CheY-like chemotaxis protein
MTTSLPAFGAADLGNCDLEPIHLPGSVQPHGLLLVLHPESLAVLQAAGDAALLGAAAPPAPGTPLAALLPPEAREAVAALAADRPATPQATDLVLDDGRVLDLQLHRTEAGVMLELEPLPKGPPVARREALPVVQAMVAQLGATRDVAELCEVAAEEVRRVTGFDRVMVYRFLPDGSGEVIAEARDAGIGAYLGLRFPASDIPRQARRLYERNWLRIIPDAGYVPAPLLPALSPLTGRPPDLSQCGLRSVSPLHLEYLGNMGVRASMSLSVLRGGALWGLIACHHRAPRPLPLALRAACGLFAQMFSLQLEAKQQAAEFAAAKRHHRVQEELVQVMAREDALAEGLMRHRPNLLDIVACEGVALLVEGRYAAIGRVPEEAMVRRLAAQIPAAGDDGVVATDCLAELWPPGAAIADVAAGVLALSIGREPHDCILWFRPEQLRAVTWAGNPNKPVELSPDGLRLSPRRSFEAWRETVRGRAQPWTAAEVAAVRALRVALLEVVLRRIDQVAAERARAKERQDLLLAELDHRVKNTLANIQALVHHSSRGARSLGEFTRDLDARIRAMARAHGLLSDSRWEGASLRALAEEVLRPHLGGSGQAAPVLLAGPELRLRPKAALSLGLALHELATNAAKYGALSVSGGRVDVLWRPAGDRLVLDWRETGGPAVSPPARRGFGTLMIERSLRYELGGTARLDFAPAGLACRIEIPLRQLAEAGAVHALQAPPHAGGAPMLRRRVLVVEDSALVAMELDSALAAAGATVIGPAARLEEAMALLAASSPDAALLDIDLDGVAVFPLADALAARGVPFLFTTGYAPDAVLPARHAGAPVLAKPYRGEEAVAALARLLDGGAAATTAGPAPGPRESS